MFTTEEIQTKISTVINLLSARLPNDLSELTKDFTKKVFELDPFIGIMPNETIAAHIYSLIEPQIIYDLEWERGDVLVFDNGEKYQLCFVDTIEYGMDKWWLLHQKTATLHHNNRTLEALKKRLKIEQDYFQNGNTIIKIEKNETQ